MSATVPPASHAGYQKALDWLSGPAKRLLIGGRWVEPRAGKTIEAINPSTETRLASFAAGDPSDVDDAVAAARRAFEAPSWAGISPHQRTRALLAIADAIDANADELAVLETLDNGTPLTSAARWVASCAQTFRYFAGWPSKILGTTNPTEADRFIYMLKEPMGVCGLINPWNAPLTMAAVKIAPALACGNTVVIKPAELTSLTTLRLAELIEAAGIPPGVLNVVTGAGSLVGSAMAHHRDIDKIAFTGSTAIGREILQASAGNMKKVTLELGGKSPNILFSDANLELAIPAAVNGFCRNSGQICSAGTRLFVHESLHDEVTEKISRLAASFKVGSPFEPDTQLGPLISAKQLDSVLSYVGVGRVDGANLSLGGDRVGDKGYFVEPTVFSHVGNRMRIAQEEIFGPVLAIIPFKDDAEVIAEANNSIYGLAAAIWTRDVSRAHRMARALKSGRVWINTYAEVDPAMSMGGYKQSGIGREQGPEAIDAYMQTKSVLMRLA